HALDQEWDSLQQMSIGRIEQLQELKSVIQDMSKEIMWVNDREEEELMFDWGDKNIDQYIPQKQESYSKLMSALEDKEKDLNKLTARVDALLKNNHPASDKIEAYKDTLQTQWSWLLQITKCIDIHLKENAAYSQFFKEANETYSILQKEHETVRKRFTCDKNTPLENLVELLKGLEVQKEKEKIMENKRQVQHLVSKSRSIVRLKPRNPEEKSSNPTIVKALCDFKQDQKVICKGNEAILKDNSQRSKWNVTGPGGLDMLVPSVCLIVPPPNPLSISLANKNEQYYEAILQIWSQLYINVKSLIAWQYCLLDIRKINSLTISVLSSMRPEEYRQLIKSLETHYEEFRVNSHGSQMFTDDDKRGMESQFNGAQDHYEQIVVQLPTYSQYYKEYTPHTPLHENKYMLECVAQAEDIVKVHEARLTEKETTSLSPSEVEDYTLTLKNIKAELDQKKDVLASMEAALAKASHWNGQVSGPFHRCDMMLSKYTEEVGLLSDRWRRLQGQIDTRVLDLQLYHPQLQTYKQTSSSLIDWIDATRKKQDTLQTTKIESIQALTDHINKQKALNSEIIERRETVESVLKDNEACVNSIKDYETDLASYTSGLETLLNIPIKRTMLKSPSTDLNLEATQLQTRYMELLAHSGDYYKFLGELLKNMEELKIRNTRIDLLEEELRLLRENMQDRDAKNKSLEDAVSRYKLELSSVQNQMLSIEEVKQSTTLQCNATKDRLDTTKSQLADLNDEVTRLNYLLEEEKRKRRLAEERYTTQQEEYELVLRKRQKELETISRSKVEVEKSELNKEQEIQQLRRQLAEDGERIKDLQKEMSKVRSLCSTEINNFKLSYESQIHIGRTDIQMLETQRKQDAADFQLQYDRMEAERRNLEEELRRLRMSMSQAEEHRKRAEEEAHSQRAVITEEGRRRREVESQVEVLMRQRVEESSQYAEELAEVMKSLQEKSEELTYVTHSLEEETRRRRTIEEGQGVLEQTLAQLQVKLKSSSMAATQLGECKEELLKMRSELEKESRERSRVEENMNRLQGRMKDLQAVRDGLESQVENLRKANQEEVSRRRQVETELENTTMAMTEYTSTITTLRQSQEHASLSEKRGEEERLRLQEELERSLRQNKTSADRVAQLSVELKALQQQLLQEQARGKEANLRNEGLYRTIEEKSKTLNENSVELQKLKEMTETQTKERLRLEEELRAMRHAKDELLRSKQGSDDELSSQITALELQLQTSQRSNADYRNLVSELSSEREKLKLETEEIQKQATETSAMMQSIQSQHSEIVNERDALLLKLQLSEKDKDRYIRLEEELSRIKLSQDSELRNKQRLQEEIERMKRDVGYWKDQYESKEGLIRQYDIDKERLEREKNSLKSEIERLMRELRELDEIYKSRLSTMQKELQEVAIVKRTMETELTRVREPPTLDASTLVFDGVRKPVTANQLLDCGVLDKPTFSQLVKGHKTVPEVSVDKKISLKGTGPIAGVVIEGPKGSGSITAPQYKMTFTEAKKENLMPSDSVDLLLDAQAATGHIIDPRTNQKLTVEEAYNQGVVDEEDRERLLAAEAAAVGYGGPGTSKPLSVFQAMQKGLIDKTTTLRLLQAQESVGGILDPVLSVFLPKDTAIERNLINDDIYRALNQRPELYLDPESEDGVTYMSMKRRCKVEPHTGLLLLPIPEKVHPSKLIFDGVRKPVTAKQLLDCGVLDRPTFKALENGERNVPEVSVDKNINLKGTGPIAGVVAGSQGKMSLSEAKKQLLLPEDSADLLLEAQAATGHIIDPRTNQKLTVEEACARGLVDPKDRDRLLAAEAAAVGYKDSSAAKPLSVFEAMKKGLIDRKTGLRLLQAQESVGGILDPNLSVFLPKDTAIKRSLLDENLRQALNQSPECYRDPETERDASYGALKKRCKTEPHTGLLLLPITEKLDPSKLIFDGVRKPVTAQQLLDCGVLDKPTLNQLMKGEKTIPQVSVDKKIFLKGTGSIAGMAVGPLGKMSLSEAKKQMLMPPDSADLLLDAQAATGHIIDPTTNQKLTVEEACARRVVDIRDRDRLLAAEAAAVGYRDPSTAEPLSVFEAMKKGLIDRKTGLRMLQAQESAGGKMSFTEAKKQKIMSSDCADMLLIAQAATGNIIDPKTNQKLTVKEACAKGVVDKEDESKLFAAEAAAIGYRDPNTGKLLSAGQAMKKGLIDKDTALRILQAQESVGGILDPALSVFLAKDIALDRDLLDQDLSQALNRYPECYIDPDTQLATTYVSLKKKCKADPSTGLLLLPEPKKPITVQGLRGQVSVIDLVDANLLDRSDMDNLREGRLTSQDIEDRLRSYLRGSTCIAGVYDEDSAKVISIYQAMKNGLLRPGTTLELLEAQAASGFIVDPVNNQYLTVSDAYNKRLFGPEFKDSLLSAERAVTGYKLPGTDKIISHFEAIERGLVEKGHGMRLLEAQIASGGIIDPEHSHRIDVNVAYKRGYFDKKMNSILTDENVNTKGFFDPNTEENLTYLELKKRCITDKKTGLILLLIMNKKKLESTLKNTMRKRRVVIVDPDTNKEMTVREAYDKGFIDYETFVELSGQECEWEEITITAPDGSTRFVIIDRKTGRQYDITELLETRVINQSDLDKYQSRTITLNQFADIIRNKTKHETSSSSLTSSSSPSRSSAAAGTSSVISSSLTSRTSASPATSTVTSTTLRTSAASVPASVTSSSSSSSSVLSRPLSPTLAKMTTTRTTTVTERSATTSSLAQDSTDSLRNISSVSVNLASPVEAVGEQEPVGAIFDTDTLEKITITEALNRGLVDSITAQRLLEAQVCTGGLINPKNGHRLSIQEATRLGIINDDMAPKLKPAQKAFFGFEDIKNRKKMSAAQAMKESWLPYEAGHRFLEFQFVTGGLYDPEMGCRRSIEDAVKMGWMDVKAGQKLQDIRHHTKNLTCPKTKLKISYKEALDNCLEEESNGLKMLQASSVSSRGISSPYNFASGPGSNAGSRSGSRQGSRRSSVDLGSTSSSALQSHTSLTTFYASSTK
uniref:Desmoplakin n=1 Tax=Sander lucioperca TaxID=283035 RepID=A0A8C9Y900_SANLU